MLEECWDRSRLKDGQEIHGNVAIFYNPDGRAAMYPIGCDRPGLVLENDRADKNKFIDEMRSRNRGVAYGGDYFEAKIQGHVIRSEGDKYPFRASVFAVELGEPLPPR